MKCKIHKDTDLICPKCRSAKGGKNRAKRHSTEKLKEWAKMGGAPKKEEK